MRVVIATAAVASLVLDASIAVAQVREAVLASGVELRSPDGNAFHATLSSIENLRSVSVPNSPSFVATWSEREGLVDVPYYAISLDGSRVVAVKSTSYQLLLRRATFDPLRDPPSFEDSPFASGGNVYIVQYVSQPLIEYSAAITALGARVYDYVGNHAHVVRMSSEVRERVEALGFVRWVGAYHPEFRVDPEVLVRMREHSLGTTRFNVQVFERGAAQQELVAQRARELGGTVEVLVPEGFVLQATLTPEQLLSIGALDEVRFIDLWGAPSEDVDKARVISGADYIEAAPGNYLGQGVQVEVLDAGCDLTHPDLANHITHGSVGPSMHGTSVAGILSGNGAGNFQARGLMPSSTLVSADYDSFAGGNRYTHTAELVDPSLPYQCVAQSNSWGGLATTQYTIDSSQMDDIVLQNDLLICQSQGNTGTSSSRPEAWAKNALTVGGIGHWDTLMTNDDSWTGASVGPAFDGRVKPDLAHFYDAVLTTDVVGAGGYDPSNYTATFGGTSASTPITAGASGLFFQMWHDGLFGNTPVGATVFAGRPHFTLAKAALINTASQYPFSGAFDNLTRTHQGWGRANVQTLYDLRARTMFVDQTTRVSNLGGATFYARVVLGEPELRATLVYRDAMGFVAATQHRKNDLSLKVTSPLGAVFYGNNGLGSGVWSVPGGVANTKDTVENVFTQDPRPGTWTIEVLGDDINTDPLTNTPASSTDFALWVTGAVACDDPTNYCTAKLTSAGTLPAIGASGSASVSGPGFAVTLTNAVPGKNGLAFFGNAPNAAVFHGGTLCVHSPVMRLPVFTTDALGAASTPVPLDPSLAGATRFYQCWFRDPLDPDRIGLSDGLRVTFCD